MTSMGFEPTTSRHISLYQQRALLPYKEDDCSLIEKGIKVNLKRSRLYKIN